MSAISPVRAPFVIAESYPELSLVNGRSLDTVEAHIESAPGLEAFRQSLMAQGPPATDSGWARKTAETSGPSPVYHWELTRETLDALSPLLNGVLTAVMADCRLKGVCWTVQPGVVPGVADNTPATQNWSLIDRSPLYGLIPKEIRFNREGNQFSLSLVNDIPRHLGAYVRFFRDAQPVSPEGWSSRLPSDVPARFESDELKFLKVINPSAAVGGSPR